MSAAEEQPPAWDCLAGPLEIVTEAGARRHDRASRVFAHLREIEAKRTPILGIFSYEETDAGTLRHIAGTASVGALNLYLGTAGLAGFRRTLGPQRFRPQTRWDLHALFMMCGFPSGMVANVVRVAA